MKALEQLISTTIKRMMPPPAITAKVISVDKEAKTCVVDDDELERTVRLVSVLGGSGETVIYPAIDSQVTCIALNHDAAQYQVIGYTQLDEWLMNGGENGGMIVIQSLTAKLNALVDAFNTHTHDGVIVAVTGGSGGPAVGTPGNSGAPVDEADAFSGDDYENVKMKH